MPWYSQTTGHAAARSAAAGSLCTEMLIGPNPPLEAVLVAWPCNLKDTLVWNTKETIQPPEKRGTRHSYTIQLADWVGSHAEMGWINVQTINGHYKAMVTVMCSLKKKKKKLHLSRYLKELTSPQDMGILTGPNPGTRMSRKKKNQKQTDNPSSQAFISSSLRLNCHLTWTGRGAEMCYCKSSPLRADEDLSGVLLDLPGSSWQLLETAGPGQRGQPLEIPGFGRMWAIVIPL